MSGTGTLVVVGDCLLDVDLTGTARRLAPDAPAPVIEEPVESRRPGGAALAAALAADSRDVVLIAPVPPAQRDALRALLPETVRLLGLPATGTLAEKTRVRAGSTVLARIDRGGAAPAAWDPATGAAVRNALGGAAGVLVADYGQGATADPQLRAALAGAAAGAPVVWDPHPRGSLPVPGVRLATPNAAEAGCDPAQLGAVRAAAERLCRDWGAAGVAVTLGERGALLSYGSGTPMVVPARRVTGGDSCGAGDCFAAAAAGALADGALPSEAVSAAVGAAADFVAAGGASGWTAARTPTGIPAAGPDGDRPTDAAALVGHIRRTGGTVVATGGCFDLLHAGHVATLEQARALGDALVVCLNSDASVRRLKGPGRPLQPQADRARVLAALQCVDAVWVFDDDTPTEALRSLRPDVWVKGGDYAGAVLPEAHALAEWGGQAVSLPYLAGRSTSSLVDAARARG